jgi:hypothetical protein
MQSEKLTRKAFRDKEEINKNRICVTGNNKYNVFGNRNAVKMGTGIQ